MQVSEAINLQRSDLTSDGLLIRQSKNGESRLLPIHSTTRDAISVYLQQRDRACPTGDDLFISNNGRAPSKSAVSNVFIHLARQLGFRGPDGTPGPRLPDLRHRSEAHTSEPQ